MFTNHAADTVKYPRAILVYLQDIQKVLFKEHEVLQEQNKSDYSELIEQDLIQTGLSWMIGVWWCLDFAYYEKAGSKKSSFDLHVQIHRKGDTKIVCIRESFSHHTCPLFSDSAHFCWFVHGQNLFWCKKITIYHHDKCLVVCKRITWFYTFITKIKDQVKLSNCHQYFCIVCFVHQSSHQRNICMNRTAPKSSELLLSSHSVWYTWEGKDANSGSHIQSGYPVETGFRAKRKAVILVEA